MQRVRSDGTRAASNMAKRSWRLQLPVVKMMTSSIYQLHPEDIPYKVVR